MVSPELEHLWNDPRNWTFPGIYRCSEDPRVIVSKRARWAGWTLNFAHRRAWWALLGLMLIAGGPTVALVLLVRNPAPMTVVVTMLVSVAFVILICIRESGRQG